MSGAQITVDLSGIGRIQDVLDRIASADMSELLEVIGATVESQTRRRISDDKTAPDGSGWDDWSGRHARTRHGGHSLLESSGDLLDSITHDVIGAEAVVGADLIYAATHQFGDDERNIPARPYLGLSDDNETELGNVVRDWVEELLQ